MARRFVVLALLVVLSSLLSLSPSARAQAVYGSIFGTVTDPSGAAVPGAKVTVTDLAKGTSDTATTNDTGNYSVTHLIPDTYSVRVESQGFKTGEQRSIAVNADVSTHVNVQLQLGAVSEAVEVTGAAPELKTDRADVATIFNDKAVEDLPLFNRNFTALVLASPGAQQLGWSPRFQRKPAGQPADQGQRTDICRNRLHAGWDRQSRSDPRHYRDQPTLESVTEAKMTSQNYDAEFGQAIAGVVASQTKSGSNAPARQRIRFPPQRCHPGARPVQPESQQGESGHRPDPIPPILYGQYGGSVGGPMIKDKIFFFGDYQATRSKIGSSFLQSVPSDLVRSTCGVAGSGESATSASTALSRPDVYTIPPPEIADGSGGAPFSPFVGTGTGTDSQQPSVAAGSCSAATVPCTRLAPGLINNFAAGGNGVFNNDQFNIRIDDQTTSKLHTFGRYSFANYTSRCRRHSATWAETASAPADLPAPPRAAIRASLGDSTMLLSASVLTDFRFGYVRYHVNVVPNGVGTTPATDIGIPGLNTGNDFTSGQPSYFVGNSGGDGTDTGQIRSTGGISNFGYGLGVNRCNCPLIEQEDQFQFVNNWTKSPATTRSSSALIFAMPATCECPATITVPVN